MRDRECINRFLAFHENGLSNYTGNMDNFLKRVLEDKRDAPDSYWEGMTNRFLLSMELNRRVFGAYAFRKVKDGNRRSVINVALFDVFSVLFAKYGEEIQEKHDKPLQDGFLAMLEEEEFSDAISFATNGVKKVEFRFRRANTMLEEVLR